MKVEIEIDLTPEEARTLLGLPDLKPLHDVYLNRMTTFVEKGVTPEMMGDMVRSWSSLGGAGMGLIQQVLGSALGGNARKNHDPAADPDKPGGRKR